MSLFVRALSARRGPRVIVASFETRKFPQPSSAQAHPGEKFMKSSLRRKSTFSKVAIRVLLSVAICLLVAGVIFTAATKAPAQSVATIAPTQKLYSVGETMIINGTGFSANANIYL